MADVNSYMGSNTQLHSKRHNMEISDLKQKRQFLEHEISTYIADFIRNNKVSIQGVDVNIRYIMNPITNEIIDAFVETKINLIL